ncbi:MAG TPA: antibiotic biosynthesis monooxygenase [Verrucomicrobiae bacterium]|jgi:heme-degrading monooxygenase HmoA|nr:antibiotic biosynthesis monooxygenase [Verrucomicrobiae bacterium]
MFARIGTWQGTAEELERWIVRGREQVKPAIRQDPGLTAVYWLVDREAGKGLIVTLWESREAMAASEQARAARQGATSTATGARVTTDRYEVVDWLTP